jgi:hypothetical protein
MAAPAPLALWQIKQLVNAHLVHTRPAGTTELNEAINFGLGKVRRALRSVRPQPQLSFLDNFQLLAGQTEYDVSALTPPLIRPVKFVVPQQQGSAQIIMFRYFASESQDFLEAENNPQGGYTWVLYDLMEGLFPSASSTLWNASSTSVQVQSGQPTFPVGSYVMLPGCGSGVIATPPPGTTELPTDYYGIVTSLTTGGAGLPQMNLAPPIPSVPTTGMSITLIRRKLLRLVPALSTSATGRFWYQYTRERLQDDGDLVEPVVAEHIDCLVSYALSRLKLAVGDADTDRWLSQAEAMRSEMMQDVDLGSWQNTEHLGSDLIGLVDW